MELQVSVRSQDSGVVRELVVPLDRPAIIGRGAENAIRVDGEAISREHVSIALRGSELAVTDLSSNGSLLNGTKLRRGSAQPAKPGDIVAVPGWDIIIGSPAMSPEHAAGTAAPQASAPAVHPVFALIRSFTPLERVLVLLSLGSIAFVAMYLNS